MEREIAKTLLRGKFDTVGSNAPVEAGCLISVNITADSKRDGGMMRRLSQSLVELQGVAKEPIRRDDTKEEV